MSTPEEQVLADTFKNVLAGFAGQTVERRLRLRLQEPGDHQRDEVAMFRLLQKACRESTELAAALEAAELGAVASMNPKGADPQVGRLVNAFNRFVEAHWR
ncbi:MAG: hypothetical protein JNK72_06025 [Myxococcales bacterium]|nr:hypothetical protein [Myxococcales bacterium]